MFVCFIIMFGFVFCFLIQSDPETFLNVTAARNFLKNKYPYDREFYSRQALTSSIFNSYFSNIHIQSNGGALFCGMTSLDVEIDGCCFCFVSAYYANGGAIYLTVASLNLTRSSGYQCEASSSSGYGTFIYASIQATNTFSNFLSCVAHRCPNQNSLYLSSSQSSTFYLYFNSNQNSNFLSSNISDNYLTYSYGHIRFYYGHSISMYYNTIANNRLVSSSTSGLIQSDYVQHIALEYCNILKNSGSYSYNSLIYVTNGGLYDFSDYVSENTFYYCLRAGSYGAVYLTNSYFGTNFFTYATYGSCSISLRAGTIQSSPTFDLKCWLYYSLFTSAFSGCKEKEIDLGSLYISTPTQSSGAATPTPSKSFTPSPTSSLSPSPSPSISPSLSSSPSPSPSEVKSTSVNEQANQQSSQMHFGVIFGVLGAAVVFLLIVVIYMLACRKRKRSRKKSTSSSSETEKESIPPSFNSFPQNGFGQPLLSSDPFSAPKAFQVNLNPNQPSSSAAAQPIRTSSSQVESPFFVSESPEKVDPSQMLQDSHFSDD